MNLEDLFKESNNFIKYKDVRSLQLNTNEIQIDDVLITIAIPTYKRPNLLKKAIDSALSQIEVDFQYEVIVVDNEAIFDKNTETEQLIRSYSNNRLIYYKNQTNIGMIGNWNRCIELARGKWVAFLHDDDIVNPDYLFKINKMINRKSDIGGIIANYKYIDENNSEIQLNKNIHFKELKNVLKNFFKNRLIKIRPIDINIWSNNPYGAPTCGSIFYREYLINEGGFDDQLFPSADWLFLVKYNKKHKVYKTIDFMGCYRIGVNESLSPDTIRKFVIDAEHFKKYNLKHSFISLFMSSIFKYEDYVERVHAAIEADKSNSLMFDSFEDYAIYKNRPFMRKLYRKAYQIYWNIKKIIALLFG